ncbi:sigma-54-dependent Fis family transcriptional regulator [Acetonema longum]|uniref:PAS sensor protein n=1 Tax=Acetonema longum DSM 6540 TaxID=1009370 RepID=F7NJN2_9FIRM|nr:sigma-54-dependent Fis family transcriptional regulator [Acetonema longum]EGO63753.1 PAS sensor protein [Acetonema longum DSM 6540]
MIKVILFAPYQEYKQFAEEVFAELAEEDVELQAIYAIGVKFIETRQFECDAVIARGVTASALRQAYTAIPVIDLPVTGYDVIHAVHQCRQRFQARKIAVMGSDSMIYGAKTIAAVLGVEIVCYAVEREEDAERCLQAARQAGTEAVISGAMAVAIAGKMGMNAVLIESGKEAIFQAVREAVRTARVARLNQEAALRVKAIMDYAYEGIVAIDEKGIITVFNKTAEEIIRVKARTALGRHIRSVLPRTGLLRVLETGMAELGELQEINGVMVAKNRVPVKVKDRVAGAVATFQNAARLQEMEGRIREKIHHKGLAAKYSFADLIGASQALRDVIEDSRKFSGVDSNILLTGETGTGKELIAQSCHNASRRRTGPFVAVNCAALPENLLESEFFGYVEGAFTGAAKGGKPGLFELAHRGTIFLDEVSEIPLPLQGRLLRVLQEREIMRLGDDRVIPVDVRVISATNKNIRQLSAMGRFREDLLYRLDVLHIKIPPLRERDRDRDILLLVRHFLSVYSHKFSKNITRLSPAAEEMLLRYSWPGNVCERLAVLADGSRIEAADVVKVLDAGQESRKPGASLRQKTREAHVADLSEESIRDACKRAGGNKTKAAELLGVSRTTLWRRLAQEKNS